mgnify:CR=1 FL=1
MVGEDGGEREKGKKKGNGGRGGGRLGWGEEEEKKGIEFFLCVLGILKCVNKKNF